VVLLRKSVPQNHNLQTAAELSVIFDEPITMITKCWICETEDATTNEHVVMQSVVELILGKIEVNQQAYFHYNDGKKNIPIKSYKNNRLTFNKIICGKCNGSLSQPYDNEFRAFVVNMQKSKNLVISREKLPLVKFQREKLANYFIKILGCLLEINTAFINENDRNIFRNSILSGKVLTNNVFVSFHRDINLIAKKNMKIVSNHPVFGAGFRAWLIDLDWISLCISYPFGPIQNCYGTQWNLSQNIPVVRIGKRS